MPTKLVTASSIRKALALDVALWHEAEVHRPPRLGRPTAALPTADPERRFIGAFQTRFRGTLNAYF
jgi:hypothetical protein